MAVFAAAETPTEHAIVTAADTALCSGELRDVVVAGHQANHRRSRRANDQGCHRHIH